VIHRIVSRVFARDRLVEYRNAGPNSAVALIRSTGRLPMPQAPSLSLSLFDLSYGGHDLGRRLPGVSHIDRRRANDEDDEFPVFTQAGRV